MDGTAFAYISQLVPWATFAVLMLILHLEARRRGGSLWADIGPKGWLVGLLAVFASVLLASVVVVGLQSLGTSSTDWVSFSIEAVGLAGVGVAVFALARYEYLRGMETVR